MCFLHFVLIQTLALLAGPTDAAMVPVPAGPFLRGDDARNAADADERPRRRVFLSAFHIDRLEVTAGSYAICVAAGRCPEAAPSADPRENLPAVGVTWHGAAAYCAFAGKRLPTEAEWEKAARGDTPRTYPWGDDFACARGNFGCYKGDGRCADQGAPGHPVPVGSYPAGASPYGALDMAGNVWEWVADRYAPGYYQRAPAQNPQGPKGLDGPDRRVLRGGGCCSIFGLPRTADRIALPPDYQDVDIGFRCAR